MKYDRNQMFGRMNLAALQRLSGRDPTRIAENADVRYDPVEQTFSFRSIRTDLTVTYPDYKITPQLPGWHRLLVLHYLDLADGHPLTGREISFSMMKAGTVRGGNIDRKCEQAISRLKETDLARIGQSIGAEAIVSNADLAFRIPLFPRFPVTLKIWLPDEEFPASGRLLVDASADHYLTIEDAVTLAEILIETISAEEGAIRSNI